MSNDPVNIGDITVIKNSTKDNFRTEQIYDPDLDPSLNNGRYVPAVGNIVVTDDNILYIVTYVDPSTFKSTLKPANIIYNVADEESELIYSYKNEQLVLFFDDRIDPVKIHVDAKVVIYGSRAAYYRIVRETESGVVPISVYINNNGTPSGNMIPLQQIGGITTIKRCTNSHTLQTLSEGEELTLEIYDSSQVQIGTVRLVVRRATIFNDLISAYNPIVSFDATCNQTDGDYFVIYEEQDPLNLGITPILTYADGTLEQVVVDNESVFTNGLSDFIPSFPGHKQKFLIKYYLTPDQEAEDVVESGSSRFIYVEKTLLVKSRVQAKTVKIATIPIWNPTASNWSLKHFAYVGSRDMVRDITDDVTLDTEFNGALFNQNQEMTMTFDASLLDENVSSVSNHIQSLVIRVRELNSPEPYIIKDSSDSLYAFGAEGDTHRPVIRYSTDDDQYYIPSALFTSEEEFLEAFYINSNPLYDSTLYVEPTTPTHFTLRNGENGVVLLNNPIPVATYDQFMSTVNDGGVPGGLVGETLIVEFLEYVNEEYKIIYGAPVLVG